MTVNAATSEDIAVVDVFRTPIHSFKTKHVINRHVKHCIEKTQRFCIEPHSRHESVCVRMKWIKSEQVDEK